MKPLRLPDPEALTRELSSIRQGVGSRDHKARKMRAAARRFAESSAAYFADLRRRQRRADAVGTVAVVVFVLSALCFSLLAPFLF